MPDYEGLALQGVFTDEETGIRVFVGQRAETFAIDLGAVFDTINLRAETPPGLPGRRPPLPVQTSEEDADDASNPFGVNNFSGFNINTIAIEVPIQRLIRDFDPASSERRTIGVWARTLRQRKTTRRAGDSHEESEPLIEARGRWVQVSRMANPLVNELIIPFGLKDLRNTTLPEDEARFVQAYRDLDVANELELVSGVPVPEGPREDIVSLLLQYQGARTGPLSDLLRLDMVRNSRLALRVALSALVWLASLTAATPFAPVSDDELLEILPASSHTEERELRALREVVREHPENLSLALRIAWRYVDPSRRSGEPRYQGWATDVVRPWLTRPEPPTEVLPLRATLRQHSHDFEAALGDLSRVLARNPRDGRAWFSRATIHLVQGELDAAWRSCLPLLQIADALAGTSCLVRVSAASGHAAEGFAVLRDAITLRAQSSPRLRLFALTSLAEIAAQLGRNEAADRHFHESLALGAPDVYLITAYADFLLDQRRPREVLQRLEGQPRSDGLLLRRVLARM